MASFRLCLCHCQQSDFIFFHTRIYVYILCASLVYLLPHGTYTYAHIFAFRSLDRTRHAKHVFYHTIPLLFVHFVHSVVVSVAVSAACWWCRCYLFACKCVCIAIARVHSNVKSYLIAVNVGVHHNLSSHCVHRILRAWHFFLPSSLAHKHFVRVHVHSPFRSFRENAVFMCRQMKSQNSFDVTIPTIASDSSAFGWDFRKRWFEFYFLCMSQSLYRMDNTLFRSILPWRHWPRSENQSVFF